MQALGVAVLFLLGVSVINVLAYGIRPLEKIGFAFPVGMGINSIVMMVLDLAHLSLKNITLLLTVEVALIVLLGSYTFFKQKPHLNWLPFSGRIDLLKTTLLNKLFPVNAAWVFLILCTGYILYAVITQAMFWPVYIYDSITGFDFVAKAIVQEGTFNNALFDAEYPLYTLRSIYPPLVPVNFAFAYLTGFSSSHIVVALCYVSMAVSFYLLVIRFTTHLGAALFTLLLVITPQLVSFSAMSSSNPVCACYVALGILCLYCWYKLDVFPFLNLGTLLLALAAWTRPEAIVFAAAGGLMVLWKSIEKRSIVLPIVFGVCCIAVFVLWKIYLKQVLQLEHAQPASSLVWDEGKLSRMWEKVVDVTFNTRYYGIIVYLFLGMVVLNIINIIRYKDQGMLLTVILAAWVLYLLVFYQIDTDFKPGSTNWIGDAYRRGLFSFFPPMLFYAATNRLSVKVFKDYLRLSDAST